MKFEWNEIKAARNLKKHHISFTEAALIFSDPFIMTIPDIEHSGEEDREISMGLVPFGKTLTVVHTVRVRDGQEWVRIISARAANQREKSVYFERRKSYEETL